MGVDKCLMQMKKKQVNHELQLYEPGKWISNKRKKMELWISKQKEKPNINSR